jgi:hypothetical protein
VCVLQCHSKKLGLWLDIRFFFWLKDFIRMIQPGDIREASLAEDGPEFLDLTRMISGQVRLSGDFGRGESG